MTLTTVPAIATGTVWNATEWTTYLRSNLNDLIAFANGTAPFVGSAQAFANDGQFYAGKSGNNPFINFDANDYLIYDRAGNTFNFAIGGTQVFRIDANGLIQAAAFTSAEQSVASGGTINVAHGLGLRPRWATALYGVSTGAANCTRQAIHSQNSLGAFFRMKDVDATNLVFHNETAVTLFFYAFALK